MKQSNSRNITYSIPITEVFRGLLVTLPVLYAWASTTFEPPTQLPTLFDFADNYICALVGDNAIKGGMVFLIVAHTLESLYTLTLAWKHVSSPVVGVCFPTFLISSPRLNRCPLHRLRMLHRLLSLARQCGRLLTKRLLPTARRVAEPNQKPSFMIFMLVRQPNKSPPQLLHLFDLVNN